MIDSHAHLFDEAFNNDYDEVLDRAFNNGVEKIIMVGFSKKTNELAYRCSKSNNKIFNSAGIHPSEVKNNYLAEISELEEFIKTHKVYALGECGLDYYWDKTYIEQQKDAFKKQIELSIKYNLPLIIHSRDALQDTYNILKDYPNAYGVMHCYSGSLEMALEFIKLGFYISLGGPVTFKNAKEPKRVAVGVPIDRILIETDSPYLAPVPYRGKRNESSFLINILEEIAKLRDMECSELEKILDDNTKKLFRLEM